MFETIQTAPPDPILGITEAFQKDPRDGKINLSVGVFKDESGATPVLASVKEAERRLLEQEKNKLYKPIQGDPTYGLAVRRLLFGASSARVEDGSAVTCHTPGGTGALRLAADFLVGKAGAKRIWVSDPTWENHRALFAAAGLEIAGYRYFDASSNGLDFAGMKQALAAVSAGDAVLLHACCHNPSGVDPTPAQWVEIAELLRERGALPLVDFAYQGFGDGIEADAAGLRALLERHEELLVCSSFSKNFGLYNERTGALTAVTKSRAAGDAVQSQLKVCARVNYSNPPAHGGAIVTTILGDAELNKVWEQELAAMCTRITAMRSAFVEGLAQAGAQRDFSFITAQKGMFSFSGLNEAQVERLKAEHAIYVVRSGRINVAGMSQSTMPQLCKAIASVL
jgi:aspartate/tyrosine/aromatic aminotransferase